MFDLSFAELALIVVVAVMFIGPKELPVVIKAIAKVMRGVRSLAKEMRSLFDDIAKESGLDDTAAEINRETKMIMGDDGKMYEAYNVSHMQPLPTVSDKIGDKKHDV